jgi:DNA-binding beta-propeller fold protein YncE
MTPDGKTAYVFAGRQVVPIDTTTNKAGRPVTVGHVAGFPDGLAITPDGKFVLAVFGVSAGHGGSATITPISTSANRAGRALALHGLAQGMAIAPDGETAYIALAHSVVPLHIAADMLGKSIELPAGLGDLGGALVVTADGKTLYVLSATAAGGRQTGLVYPVSTATDKVGRPVRVGGAPFELVIEP